MFSLPRFLKNFEQKTTHFYILCNVLHKKLVALLMFLCYPSFIEKHKELHMNTLPSIPNEYRPMSAWGYIGYQILFAIPVLGFILLLVFALDGSYIARRNFARSYFIIVLVVIGAFVLFGSVLAGMFSGIIDSIPTPTA